MTTIEFFTNQHLDETFSWMQDQSLKDSFLLRKEITRNGHLSWFEQINNDNTQLIFAIQKDGFHCGNCGLKNINIQDKNAELWIYIGNKAFRGKGVAKASINLLLEHAFNDLKLHKIYLHVLESNNSAIHLYNKCGFSQEGHFKDDIFYNNKYHSLYRMSFIYNE